MGFHTMNVGFRIGFGSGLILSGTGVFPPGFRFSGTRLHHYHDDELIIYRILIAIFTLVFVRYTNKLFKSQFFVLNTYFFFTKKNLVLY